MATEPSILKSTKKNLGIQVADASFDPDVMTHINSTLVIVKQLGLGPDPMVYVEDETQEWEALALTPEQLNICKTYLYLRVRMLFDPPTMGFLITAMQDQLTEFEHRLSMERENAIPLPTPQPIAVYPDEIYYFEEVLGLP
jgi:hypothetical protein